jgi:hypothetical protein
MQDSRSVEQNPLDRRRSLIRLVALAACVAALAGVFVAANSMGHGDDGPLQPNDRMALWREASPERKLATAEVLLQELQDSNYFGPISQSKVKRAVGRRHRREEIVTALDDATNIDIPAYVSPSQSMLRTIEDAGRKLDWDK